MKIEREIRNDHLARIEGKAGVVVEIGEKINARINVTEGPRFFEVLARNRKYEDVPSICSRICSFCSIPHKLTPIEAIENALSIEVSEQTKEIRNMLYFGNVVESHALHLLLFVLPDYLGFADAFSMAKNYQDLMKKGLLLKNFGAMVQEIIGKREIHPENPVVGGFGKLPEEKEIKKIIYGGKEAVRASIELVDFMVEYEYPSFMNMERNHLSIKPYSGYGVYGDEIVASDGNKFKINEYKNNIEERVIPYSFSKGSYYKNSPFMVGALSRLVNNGSLIDGSAKDLLNKYSNFIRADNCFANNFAQAVEMVYFIEKIVEIAEKIKIKKEEKAKGGKSGHGFAVTEAPRGILIYEVEIEDEIVKYMNVITPTAMFLPMMERDAENMARGMWNNGYRDVELIGKKVEMAIRAYDPCISCSVHAVKK
ncbi:MAG: Ni/Fe hydrogenase subunit alpha [Thermoplasmatales archaeon]|nr:Ni/Fe hydrogenase subunit alpha [Thermoplasmatales archaeon]